MARKNIQGITIEIGGDTTKLQTALRGVESKLKDTQAALRDTNRLLKLDPGNVELLTQKQKQLTDSIEATKDKLKTLRDASDQVSAAMANGDEKAKAQYDALQREIIETEQNLKSMTGEMKNFGSVAAQQIAAAGQKVQELGGKITKAGTALTKNVTAPIVAVGAASVAAFSEVDDGLDIIVKKTGATGKALEDMEERAKNLATSIPTDFLTAGTAIGEVNTRFGLTGEALEALSGKFIKFAQLNDTDVNTSIDSVQAALAAFGLEAKDAADVLDILNKAAQDTGVDVNKLSGDLVSNAAALQDMGYDLNKSAGFLSNLSKNGLDYSAVLAGMKKAQQNAVKQGKTLDRALGDMQTRIKNAASDTEAMSIATELFGAKAAPAMAKAIRDSRLSFDELGNAVRDWGDSVDNTFENTLDPVDEFKTALNELKIVGTDLVTTAAPMIKNAAQMVKTAIGDIRKWWEGLSPLQQETVIKIAGIVAAVGPLLVVIGKVTTAVGSIMSLAPKITGLIGTVKTATSGLWAVLAANPIALVIGAVAALAGGFIYLWNTSEEFRQFWIDLWDNAKNTVHNAIEKIKDFFKFEWELPKLKLPHFSINGSFSLNPPSVPHLSVDWYRKAMQDGMILNSPTIFGMKGNKLLGGGEAGSEAVVGTESLSRMIASAVASGLSGLGNGSRSLTVILELDKMQLGKTVYQLNNEETQRVGVRLATT